MDPQVIKAFDKFSPECRRIVMYLVSKCELDQRSYTLSNKKIAEIAGCSLSEIDSVTDGLLGQGGTFSYDFPNGDKMGCCIIESIKHKETSMIFNLSTEFRQILFGAKPEDIMNM
jgi:hypothetical protein